ncbi:unnamed protein product [Kuraishia capsulata CBS 1993]|uniref:Uncharacterized protein n=1 Tax=Kuraishia capsulata CBS 1993 TaxID=1382522 RepID=W6MS38_9ASCO|nr:uncharacterized protein KUCA_T00005599001 [Kuraishia capsulata CBS 1993]CDK29606.1 unnamed protein product [Kuraishia capsulata CBS 1993]
MFIQDEFCLVDGQPCMANSLYCSERCRLVDSQAKCSHNDSHHKNEWLYPSQIVKSSDEINSIPLLDSYYNNYTTAPLKLRTDSRNSSIPSLIHENDSESDYESECGTPSIAPATSTGTILNMLTREENLSKPQENYYLWLRSELNSVPRVMETGFDLKCGSQPWADEIHQLNNFRL